MKKMATGVVVGHKRVCAASKLIFLVTVGFDTIKK